MEEVDEISNEDLEAAAIMYDELVEGTFYQKQLNSGFRIKFIGEEGGNNAKASKSKRP